MKQLSNASHQQLRRLFWILLFINFLFIIGTGYYLRPLTSKDIVAFELARELPVAEKIIHNWQSTGLLDKARQSIYIDFVFIFLYIVSLSVAGIFIARLTKHELLIRSARLLLYLLIIAGISDSIENIALLKNLYGTVSKLNVTLAYDMAATKFSILILVVLFIAVCLVFWGLRKLTERRV